MVNTSRPRVSGYAAMGGHSVKYVSPIYECKADEVYSTI